MFAEDYIQETVQTYKICLQENVNSAELRWAKDVLNEYFSVIEPSHKAKIAYDNFVGLVSNNSSESPVRYSSRKPYRRESDPGEICDYKELLNLSRRRRSVRWYKKEKVPRELIKKALAIAAESPSACNRQPFYFQFFDDPLLVQKVIQFPPGIAGFEKTVPCVAVVIGQQRYYSDEKDRHLIYIDASLAVMSFILALETLGLSSCCINWPDIEEREEALEDFLGLAEDERPIMFLSIGFPDIEGMVPYSEKKPLSILAKFNER